MIVRHRVLPDCYRDSVALLALSARIAREPGVVSASVTMATPANLAAAAALGVDGPLDAGPADVLVVVVATGSDASEASVAADAAVDLAESTLVRPVIAAVDGTAAAAEPVTTIADALETIATADAVAVALISVPGPFAAAEARKALDAGLHVMIFSDNVDVAAERSLKELGRRRGRLVMGPDCGTAVLDGVPLGFANVVRPGRIGLIGASGTGLQEVATQLHHLGAGVSQIIGTGGRDLGAAVGGLATEDALGLLARDPATDVIVLVSKPADPEVAARVLRVAASTGKPVVTALLGSDPAPAAALGLHPAQWLADAAVTAAALVTAGDGSVSPRPSGAAVGDGAASSVAVPLGTDTDGSVPGGTFGGSTTRRCIRGLFCGGTLAYEAQLVLLGRGEAVRANAPAPGAGRWAPGEPFEGHVVVDQGDDAYTVGRPHPMIDPSARDALVAEALQDATVAVVLVDIVLGHGAGADPVAGLVAARRAVPRHTGPVVIAHVCGTDLDPLPRRAVVEALTAAGVVVAPSNVEAAMLAVAGLEVGRAG